MADEKFELTRRKALAGLGTIGAASAGAGLGTSAYFNDTESFTGNSVQAGELDLFVDYETSVSQGQAQGNTGSTTGSGTIQGGVEKKYVIKDAKPGDSGQLVFCPKVVDNPGYLWVGGGVTGYENGQTEPEAEGDTSGGDPGQGHGELAESILVTVSYCEPDGSGGYTTIREMDNPSDYTLADLGADLANGFQLDGEPDHDDGDPSGTQAYPASSDSSTQTGPCICVDWNIPGADVGNEIQTDSVEFDVVFEAVQERHNSATNPFSS